MKERLENIMEGTLIAMKSTIDPETRNGLTKRYNRANFLYLKRYGESYIPKGEQDERETY